MKRVVTFGEIMLRLSTQEHQKIIQAGSFDVHYGGGEANVAVSLARFGLEAEHITKLPENPLGEAALCELQRYGVKTGRIIRGGERMGIYYLEPGASVRPSHVIYDRKHSSFAEANPEEYDFDSVMEGADWFHLTGITPALSDKAAKAARKAMEAAKRHGVPISMDLNYRKTLWGKEEARRVMADLLPFVNVCLGGRTHMGVMLGIKPLARIEGSEVDLDGYRAIFEQMKSRFGIKRLISSLRESPSASDNAYGALLYDGSEMYRTRRYEIRIVDRIGGGDAFAAGLICGLLEGMSFFEAGEFAAAASALKHTIPGDVNLVSKDEVARLINEGGSGRVQR